MTSSLIKFHSILTATDFSADSERAFAHALKAAVDERSSLFIMHVGQENDEEAHWEDFPSVRGLLEKWGLLPAGASREAVYEKLGVIVEKLAAESADVGAAITSALKHHSIDLLVMATHGKHGLPRWFHRSVSEPVARQSRIPVLFVPHQANGFVSLEDGSVKLRRVLIPVDHEPNPAWAPQYADALLNAFEVQDAEITFLHVGDPSKFPEIATKHDQSRKWTRLTRPGKVVDEILAVAKVSEIDLIVMITQGHHGFWDALRGSTTEQVLRQAPCPILMVPNL
jgi:nucleotide-binding universal stress UspA family protein